MALAPAPEQAPGPTPPGLPGGGSTDGIYPDIQAAIAQAAAASARGTGTTGGGAGGSSNKTGSGTPAIETPYQQAVAEAQSEIAASVAPDQAELKVLANQQAQQENTVSAEFAQLLPYAQQSSELTAGFNAGVANDANAIFQAANQNMGQLATNSAQAAQQVAQATGGPAATTTLTGPMSEFQLAQQQTGEVGQLTNLELGSSATAEAAQFAGQTLPAMMKQSDDQIRAQIATKTLALQQDIAKVEGTESKIVNAKLPALQRQALTAQLDEQKIAETKLNDSHKWNEFEQGLNLKANEIAFTEAYDTGKLKVSQQTVDLRAQQLTATEKATAARLGLTAQEYALRASQYVQSDALASQRLAVEQQRNSISAINAMLGGSTSDKPITMTTVKYLNASDPLAIAAARYQQGGLLTKAKMPSNVFYDPSRHEWYTYVKQEMTPSQWHLKTGTSGTPVSDPNAIYNALMHMPPGERPSKQFAISAIQDRLGIPDWKPGQSATPSHVDLVKMSMSDLLHLATQRGFKGDALTTSKQRLIDYIRKTSPGYGKNTSLSPVGAGG